MAEWLAGGAAMKDVYFPSVFAPISKANITFGSAVDGPLRMCFTEDRSCVISDFIAGDVVEACAVEADIQTAAT